MYKYKNRAVPGFVNIIFSFIFETEMMFGENYFLQKCIKPTFCRMVSTRLIDQDRKVLQALYIFL